MGKKGILDLAFLRKVEELKKQTFTNEKIAEVLHVSVSTVKRGLKEIEKGALIPPMRKWGLTGDLVFLIEEALRLKPPNLQKPMQLLQAFDRLPNMRYGEKLHYLVFLDPSNAIEKIWLKRYKKAVLEGRTVSEGV